VNVLTNTVRWTEAPVFFDANGETLFGILTEPRTEPRGIAVVHLRGGNQGPSSGRNRTSADLCRRLAEHGFHALRFDYHGVGESTGTVDRFRHDDPFEQDVQACSEWLRDQGIERIVLVGECFGARTALTCSALAGLTALVLVSVHVRDAEKDAAGTRALVRHRSLLGYATHALSPRILRQLLNRRLRRNLRRAALAAWRAESSSRAARKGLAVPGWVSSSFLAGLRDTLRAGIPILLVNGTEDPGYDDFKRASEGTLGTLLNEVSTQVDLQTFEGRIGACADVSLQAPAIESITAWLRRVAPPMSN
jgi:dienelactone hydrolase